MHQETGIKHKWCVFFAATICVSIMFLNQTALTVILPFMQKELEISQLQTQWVVNLYLLVMTISLLAGGRLADILGHKRALLLGSGIFTLGSIGCALSPDFKWLCIDRALQGIGGALLWPSSAALLFSAFAPHERGKAMGIYVSAGTIFFTLGPFVGGFFAENTSWRDLFWLDVPLIALGMFLGWFAAPKTKPRYEPFDFYSFISFGISISALVMAFMQANEWGWSSPLILTLFGISAIFMVMLILLSRKRAHPLLDLKLFRQPMFCGANIAIFLTQFLVMLSIYWTLYYQHILDFSPTEAGAIALLSGGPVVLIAPLAGKLTDRYGASVPITAGFALLIVSLIWIVLVSVYHDYVLLLPGICLFGCGAPLIFTPSSVASMNLVEPHQRGVVSGIMMTMRQLGSTVGVAVIGSIFVHFHKNHFVQLLQEKEEVKYLDPNLFDGLLVESEESMVALKGLSEGLGNYVEDSFYFAYDHAFFTINILALILGLCGIFLVRRLVRSVG